MLSKPLLSSETRPSSIHRLYELYPQLAEQQTKEWLKIIDNTLMINIPSETALASVGTTCTNFMLLLDGTVRVYQDAESGREMTLYRMAPGDVCLMSLNSLIHSRPFKANAVTETEVNALLFNEDDFHKALEVSDAFRKLIFSCLADTVCTMVQTFYDTVFEPLDMRLACLLGKLFERAGSDTLDVTHQELAQELVTSREVVSHLLKKLEQQECIILKRGKIFLGKNKKISQSL